ncbi:MAG: nitrilase-related carbon-nitrogen hydrolase, partial [Deinococcota bacterium]
MTRSNSHWRSYGLLALWLSLAALCSFLSSPKWTIPLAAWLGVVFLVRFVRQVSPLQGVIWTSLASIVVTLSPAFQGVFPAPAIEFVITMVIASVISTLPYLADRLISPKIRGLASTLVLPVAATTLDYLSSFNSSFGTFPSIAYTQFDNLALMQVTSLAGIWPITFLISWFGTVVNFVWEDHPAKLQLRVVTVYASIVVPVFLFGSWRLAGTADGDSSVRAAAIATSTLSILETTYEVDSGEAVSIPLDVAQNSPFVQRVLSSSQNFYADSQAERYAPVRAVIAEINDELFTLAEQEAQAGAQIISWSEANAFVFAANEEAFVARAQNLAQTYGVYLMMGILTYTEDNTRENKIIAVTPRGEVAFEYLKSKLAPGETSVQGTGVIPILDTEFGRVASTICWDMDFPSFIRQAGRQGVDIMLAPSGDWQAISPWHSRVAMVRAIENGFSLLRPVRHGLLVASDWRGASLGQVNFFNTPQVGEAVLVSNIPTKGVRTLYP